jgi:hypothetical protein
MNPATAISEEPLLAHIERRLIDEFPKVAPEDVDAVVRREHARFAHSPIRGFVPLFVEKHARDILAHAV